MIERRFEEDVPLGWEGLVIEHPLRACGEGADPGAYLLGTVEVLGVRHHLEAIAVQEHEKTGEQAAVDPEKEEYLGKLYEAFGPGDPFQTVEIDEREYVLVMSPYAS